MIKSVISAGTSADEDVWGYTFGAGEKAACIVGSMDSDDVQQLYICSQLVKSLKELEQKGAIVSRNEILVIPSPGHGPGNHEESKPELIDRIFSAVKDYAYGIQLPAFCMEGGFVPHVRMMATRFQNVSLAGFFGLPYAVISSRQADDAAVLETQWKMGDGNTFSIYTRAARRIDEKQARQAVSAILRFLTRMGIIRYTSHSGYLASMLREDDLAEVKSELAGICRRCVEPGEEVSRGQLIASITDPLEGETISRVLAPTDGIIFYAGDKAVVEKDAVLFKIIRRLHQ